MSERTRRSGRKRTTGTTRSASSFNQLPWKLIKNPHAPMQIISDEQINAIQNTAFDILEDVGIDILHKEAKEILKKAGAQVTEGSDRVKIGRDIIIEALKTAPSHFTLHARNPAHNLEVGGNNLIIGSVASAPNSSDMVNGRRPGNHQDYKDMLKLCQSLNIIHFVAGYPVEPTDLPSRTRHLNCIADMAILTDKFYHAYALGDERIKDGLEITRIAHGCESWEEFDSKIRLFSIINTSSPLRLDGIMIDGAFEMAKHKQLCVVTPFTLSGAMAPVTVAGALAQQHAEAMATISLLQLYSPGCPVIYGGFTSNVDMKSGAPAFGTPEYVQAAMIGGQLARKINIPYRSSNVNASNIVDAQATYESQMSIWAAMMGHTNFMMHGCGWLEGGLCASFEKVILDAEMLQAMSYFMTPPEINEETLALNAVKDVGPGGHFFGTEHTMARYQNAFYSPILSDWNNFETWDEKGRLTATERAHKIYKQLLADYTAPDIEADKVEAIQEFVSRRIKEGGVTGDF